MWVSWSKTGQKKKWNAFFRLHKIDMAWTWKISNWSSAAVHQLTLMINTRKIIYRKNEVTSHFLLFCCGSHSLEECELYWDMNGPRRRNENRFRRVFARSRLSPTVAALKLKRILGRLFFPLQTATARAGGSFYFARERTSIELRRKCVYGKSRAERSWETSSICHCYMCMVCGIEQTIDINNKQKICGVWRRKEELLLFSVDIVESVAIISSYCRLEVAS